jgi:predicted dehydrogenase
MTVLQSSSKQHEPPSRRLRTAIIGGGRISEQHLGPLSRRPDVVVEGLCDLSPALARFSAERFGVPRWFSDYRAMLDEVNPDVVHILTPAATHVPIGSDCLERGLHVIMEKPAALSNADFRQLWDLAERQGVRFIENHNYRFNTLIQRLEQVVSSGRLGSVEEVEVELALNIRGGGRYADENLPHPSHRLPGGVIHEFISHLCCLLLRFLPQPEAGGDPTIEQALWRNRGGGSLFKYDDLDAVVASDRVTGRVRFTSFQWPDHFTVRVRGSDGVAAAELFQPSWHIATRRAVGQHLTPLVNSISGARSAVAAGLGNVWRKVRNRTAYEGLERFLDLTYDALATGTEPPVTFDDMDRVSRLIDALVPQEDRA